MTPYLAQNVHGPCFTNPKLSYALIAELSVVYLHLQYLCVNFYWGKTNWKWNPFLSLKDKKDTPKLSIMKGWQESEDHDLRPSTNLPKNFNCQVLNRGPLEPKAGTLPITFKLVYILKKTMHAIHWIPVHTSVGIGLVWKGDMSTRPRGRSAERPKLISAEMSTIVYERSRTAKSIFREVSG